MEHMKVMKANIDVKKEVKTITKYWDSRKELQRNKSKKHSENLP